MKISQMKNIIVLKDLPSNLVDEAIVILKSGSKVKSKEMAEKNYKSSFEENEDTGYEVAIKEAEYIVGDYMKSLEKPEESTSSIRKIRIQYKKMQICSALLGIVAILRNSDWNSKIGAECLFFCDKEGNSHWTISWQILVLKIFSWTYTMI